jgi:hypothetical protein
MITRFARYRKIPSLQYSADSMISTATITVSLFIYEHLQRPYTLIEAGPMILGSFFNVIGALFLNAALAYGKGGLT